MSFCLALDAPILLSVGVMVFLTLKVACRDEKTLGSLEKATTFKKATNERTAGKWGAWAQELRNIALHPEQHSPAALEVTNEAVVIADKFAKVNTIHLRRQVHPQVWRIIY